MAQASFETEWSRINIWLHWLIVLLIIVQYIDSESMVSLWDATQQGTQTAQFTKYVGWGHIAAGSTILVAAFIRLVDRFWTGRPVHPQGVPSWATWLAKITHFLIYAILFVMPSLGLLAWFTGNDTYAQYHTFFWTPLLVLVAVHIIGALAQHFVFKTNVLTRMLTFKKR